MRQLIFCAWDSVPVPNRGCSDLAFTEAEGGKVKVFVSEGHWMGIAVENSSDLPSSTVRIQSLHNAGGSFLLSVSHLSTAMHKC